MRCPGVGGIDPDPASASKRTRAAAVPATTGQGLGAPDETSPVPSQFITMSAHAARTDCSILKWGPEGLPRPVPLSRPLVGAMPGTWERVRNSAQGKKARFLPMGREMRIRGGGRDGISVFPSLPSLAISFFCFELLLLAKESPLSPCRRRCSVLPTQKRWRFKQPP
jgi:hypothetical protein